MKEDYFKVRALSKSGLVKLNQSPAHFKTPEKVRDPKLLNIGSAFHTAVLEPSWYDARFAVLDDGLDLRTKAGKERRAEAEEAGKTLLKYNDHMNIQAMAQAVREHPGARQLIDAPGPVETPVYWTDPVTGIKCKALPDKLTVNRMCLDLKSTGDARPAEFNRIAYNLHYHFSAWWYCWGLTIATGIPHKDYVFIVVERERPWGVKIYFADIDMMLLAAQEIAPLKKLYAKCIEKNEWPCYSTDPDYMHLPPWVRKKDLITGIEEAQFLLEERSAA